MPPTENKIHSTLKKKKKNCWLLPDTFRKERFAGLDTPGRDVNNGQLLGSLAKEQFQIS